MGFRRNLSTNPRLGDNGDNWAGTAQSGTGSTVTTDFVAVSVPGAPSIATAWQVKLTAGTPTYMDAQIGGTADIPVTAGAYITVSCFVMGPTGYNTNLFIRFYDASGTQVGATSSNPATLTTTWGSLVRPSWSAQAPAGSVRAVVNARVRPGSGNIPVSTAIRATGLLVEQAITAAPALDTYFDGATASARWDGVDDGSTSTLYLFAAPAVTTTEEPPSAHITFSGDDLADNVGTLTLYRLYDGKTTTVRSAINKFAVGGLAADDFELPPGVTVSYRAQVFRTDGVDLGFTPATDVFVDAVDVGDGWLSDPLDPATPPVKIRMRSTAGTGGKVDAPGQTYRVGLRTVALLAPRGLLQDVDMSFFTSTLDEYKAIRSLVDQSNGLLLIRTPPPMPVPRLLYAWTKALMWGEFNLSAGLEDFAWENPVDEISPIEGEPFSTITPWQIYIDAFPTWADFNAAYLTWLDAINNPPEA